MLSLAGEKDEHRLERFILEDVFQKSKIRKDLSIGLQGQGA